VEEGEEKNDKMSTRCRAQRRNASDGTWMDTSMSWGWGAAGYWKNTFFVLSTALVSDLTPSSGPGSGKANATRSDDSS
jgi:hypothetical protein